MAASGLILSLHSGEHDSSAALYRDYDILAAVAEERLNRKKSSGGFPHAAIDEVLRVGGASRADVDVVVLTRSLFLRRYFTHWRWYERLREKVREWTGTERMRELNVAMTKNPAWTAYDIFNAKRFLADLGFRSDARIFFSNHHFSHALPSLFHTDWNDALLYTADGSGDHVYYSHYLLENGKLENLYGDDRWFGRSHPSGSVGLAYGFVTRALGWKMNRHEGKLTGLAAYGEPTLLDAMLEHFRITDDGRVEMTFDSHKDVEKRFTELALSESKENAAASVQAFLEHCVFESARRLVERHGARRLGLAGGVFANVRLNRHLAENLPLDEVFIVPPMGDDGLVVGGPLQYLLERDGLETWMGRRRRLNHVYWGGAFDSSVNEVFSRSTRVRRLDGDLVEETAGKLACGEIGAIYTGRMEYGPRALGARTIMASPIDAGVNQSLNARLERTEFMPFAPVVAEEDAETVFDIRPVNRYAATFMTITCGVKPEWHKRIPAVVHVDGTARPQIIRRDDNPLYYDILQAFKRKTGLPVLVNTSFNVHEEPIINRPEECLRALEDKRVDFAVTQAGIWERT